MKTANAPDAQAARSALESARAFIQSTRAALGELQRQRTSIIADHEALAARPAPWTETVDEAVAAAIDDCAAGYKPSLTAWIRARNPNLERRSSYDDLPFLSFPDASDGMTSAAADCFFNGDQRETKLRELLLSFEGSVPEDQCISGRDRATQRAALDEQLQTIDGEISRLTSELDQLTKG